MSSKGMNSPASVQTDHDPVVLDRAGADPRTNAARRDTPSDADANPLADVAAEMVRLAQSPVDAGRGNLERVGAGDDVMNVEHVPQPAAQGRQLVEADTALAVEVEAQHGAVGLRVDTRCRRSPYLRPR